MVQLRPHRSTEAPRYGVACCLALLGWAISSAEPCLAQQEQQTLQFYAAGTPELFQAAMLDGVKHILLTEHLDMTDSPIEIDEEAQRQKQAIGVLKESTRSIGVR